MRFDDTTYVYFVQAPCNGLIKIGYATGDPARRVREMMTGCPVHLRILATVPGSHRLETSLHHKFWRHREHGEWFRPAPALLRWIAENADPYEGEVTPKVYELSDRFRRLFDHFSEKMRAKHVWPIMAELEAVSEDRKFKRQYPYQWEQELAALELKLSKAQGLAYAKARYLTKRARLAMAGVRRRKPLMPG